MAWMNQDKKQKLAPAIKAVLKKYGMKGTIGVNNHSTLVVNIKSGKLDILGNYADITMENMWKATFPRTEEEVRSITNLDVNTYWIHEQFSGKVREFMEELKDAMNGKGSEIHNHDNSDIQTDYFDVGWYIDINVGRWNKPYILEK